MYKKFIFTLIVLCLAGGAYGASMTIVDLPAVGTDAAIGIDAGKTYTHTLDFGTNAPAVINGVAFDQGPIANVREPYVGVSSQGYGYIIDDTREAVRINCHGGNDPSDQADGNSVEMLRDMIYFSGAVANEGIILTFQDLTPGTEYSVRFYYRAWDPPLPRPITIIADGGESITIDVDLGGAHYLDYTFVADDSDVAMEFITNDDNQGVHLYGLTCEETSAMVAHWPMDEGAGMVAADIVGGNDGTLVNMDDTAWIPGAMGTAVSFTGFTSPYILVPDSAALDFGEQDFSISMMVCYPTIPTGESALLCKGTIPYVEGVSTGKRYVLFDKNGAMRFEADDNVTKSGVSVPDSPFTTGDWVNLVAVHDEAGGTLSLYADGVLQGSNDATATGDISNGEDMFIGAYPGGDNTSLADIDDVRIYNAALNEEEIAAIYEPAAPLLINGSFELPGTDDQIYGFNGESNENNIEPLEDIPGWATDGDSIGSGIELGTANSDAAPDGDYVAFLRGIDPGIWQLTEHVIGADDVIVLSLEAKNLWAEIEPLPMNMTVYYDDNGVRVPITSLDQDLVLGEWHTFTLTSDVSAVPEAIGKKLGVEIDTPGDFTWALIDNVVLEVN